MDSMTIGKKMKNNLGYLFIILCAISLCINFKNNMTVDKFFFERSIGVLLDNYKSYNNNFFNFMIKTLPLHEGDTNSGWHSFYYLLPLFLFAKFTGGLSLFTLHLFVCLSSILCLFLFYCLLRKYWGNTAANIGVCFFSFSPFFQELARSGSYHAPSVLVALILFFFIFKALNDSNARAKFYLGLIVGLSWYYYGPLRFILPVAMMAALSGRKDSFYRYLLSFLAGITAVSLIGFILTIINKGNFFDQENIFRQEPGHCKAFYLTIFDNVKSLWAIITGHGFIDADYWLINKVLLIPLIAGLIYLMRNLNYKINKVFLLLIAAICILPVVTTAFHNQVRRYILYCIPLYFLVGIGGARLVYYLSLIKNKTVKGIAAFLVMIIASSAVSSDLSYITKNIFFNKRNPGVLSGILRFGRAISENVYNDLPVFYLQETPHRLYEVKCEADLFTLIVRYKNLDHNIKEVGELKSVVDMKKAYVIVSPYISSEDFRRMCEQENLFYRLIKSDVCKEKRETGEDVFRLYFVKKIG